MGCPLRVCVGSLGLAELLRVPQPLVPLEQVIDQSTPFAATSLSTLATIFADAPTPKVLGGPPAPWAARAMAILAAGLTVIEVLAAAVLAYTEVATITTFKLVVSPAGAV